MMWEMGGSYNKGTVKGMYEGFSRQGTQYELGSFDDL
jgi:hypothetical protein